jgi:hypothetical protein
MIDAQQHQAVPGNPGLTVQQGADRRMARAAGTTSAA